MKRILIIEDDEQVRALIKAFLEASEFSVVEAENGEVGLRLAKEHLPDLILCDVNMPKLDGYGVLSKLREEPATMPIPFIFLTGKGEREDLRQGMDLGADDYLIKPFKKAEVLRAIGVRLAKQAAIAQPYISELKQAEEKLNYILHHDNVTNLPNRLMLRDRLNLISLQASGRQQIAVLSFGLDRFKRINETLEHAAGDGLLKMVAERLVQCVSANDTVARLNADQFAVILSKVSRKRRAAVVAQTILDSISEPFVLQGIRIFTTASMGIALSSGGEDIDQLIRNAEAAMRHAKQRGGNSFVFYSPKMQALSSAELTMEAELRQALPGNQLLIHYQPQVSLKTGQIVGAEVLIRWNHPERGLVPPAQFIPLAEESGIIVQITEWVLRTACLQTKKWQGAVPGAFQVAVNLTGHHFTQQNLSERLIQISRETDLDPSLLELELTERILMKDVQTAITILKELNRLGFHVSIDDFGTGYSSLSYLKRFSFDTLKIDQSFIQNITEDSKNAAITTAIIEMAHNLNLKVIAEGVETMGELSFLASHGCDEMQGYLFSCAVPANEFEKLLTSGKGLESL